MRKKDRSENENNRPEVLSGTDLRKKVTNRVTEWISSRIGAPNSGLPKTKKKLQNTIKKMCISKEQVNSNWVLKELVEQGYLGECKTCFRLVYPFVEVLPELESGDEQYGDEGILSQIKHWIVTGKTLPNTFDGLQKYVESQKVTYVADPVKVVDDLIGAGVVVVFQEDNVSKQNLFLILFNMFFIFFHIFFLMLCCDPSGSMIHSYLLYKHDIVQNELSV